MRYLVFFEQGDTNYSAYVPDLPVCVAVGDTLEETRKEISAAMKFHIECLQEDGEAVPMPTSKSPDQTPSGISAEFVNVEIKPKKQFILYPLLRLSFHALNESAYKYRRAKFQFTFELDEREKE